MSRAFARGGVRVAPVARRRELFEVGRRGEYFRRTFVRGGWNAGDKPRGETCTCSVVFGPGAEYQYQVLSHVTKDEGAARSKHEENFAAAAAAASTRRLGNFFVAAPALGPAPSPPPPPGAAAAVATAASDAGTVVAH